MRASARLVRVMGDRAQEVRSGSPFETPTGGGAVQLASVRKDPVTTTQLSQVDLDNRSRLAELPEHRPAAVAAAFQACNASFNVMPTPVRCLTSMAPVIELRQNSRAFLPDRSAALTICRPPSAVFGLSARTTLEPAVI